MKLVLDEIIIFFKQRNPTIQEFHISLTKIISIQCNFSLFFNRYLHSIKKKYVDSIFVVTATMVLNITEIFS